MKKTKNSSKKQTTAPIVIRRSPLGGLGIFATAPIRRGDFVIEYTGEKITNEEADRRGGRYLFEINSKWTLDGKGRENTARYINHSCVPNCEAELSGLRVLIYAKRAIREGEELTYNYGEDYLHDKDTMPDGCLCQKCKSNA